MDNKSVKKLEAELWESADLLRADSKLTSNQCGLRKSRGNCTSAESFFLSKPEDSRGSSDLVCGEKMTDTL